MDFDAYFSQVVVAEGGYVNDPDDPGGETKYGISKRAYPGENIKDMTLERAKEIYRRDYWGPAGCDTVPDPVKLPLFDMAVNAGVKGAVVALQWAVGAVPDGILGPATIQSITSMSPARLVARLCAHRLELMVNLPTWPKFGKGWTMRVVKLLSEV